MRIHPENSKKAKIRAELRQKPKSMAQIAYLRNSFMDHATMGKVDLAHTALHNLPKDEQNQLDKSTYLRRLIEQNRNDLIDEIRQHGTPKDHDQLYTESLRIIEKKQIDNLLTSLFQKKPKKENKIQTTDLFACMKTKLNTMLGRSAPITAENLTQLSEKTEVIDDEKTDSMSNQSNDPSEDNPEQDHTHYNNRI